MIRKWLVANDRLAGPKFIVGESYGGFRAPKLARRLEQIDGIGIDGLSGLSFLRHFNDEVRSQEGRICIDRVADRGGRRRQ